MKNTYLGLVLAVVMGVTGCNQPAAKKMEAKPAESKGVNIKPDQLASNKDYNCGMTLEAGGIADTTTYEGKLYGFCSPECKAEFLKDPKAHLAQK